MNGHELDISGLISWEDGLPRPQWDLIETLVESNCPPDARRGAWIVIGQQWLYELGQALGGGYKTSESDNFSSLVPQGDDTGGR